MKYRNDWHTISAEETAKRLRVNPYTGLSEKEVRRRRSGFGRNRIWRIERMEAGKFILRTAGDLSTVLLIITAVLAFLFEESADAVTMCIILALGAALRIITYIKAKRILEDNAAENIPTAAVLRDSAITLISAVDLVPGDIVLLHPGDTVPCDGRVIADTDALVTESGVTENRGQIRKFDTAIHAKPGSAAIPCESRPNILFAGSMVLQGELRMIATATGRAALVSMKQGGIEIPSGDSLPIIERLGVWCRNSELVMLAFVVLISALSLFTDSGMRLEPVFFGAVSMAAASMSEYLTTISYIIIAIAVRNSSGKHRPGNRKGAVITDCSKIEDIAAADTVILGDMSLMKSGEVSFGSFFVNGKLYPEEALDAHTKALQQLLTLACEATGTAVGVTAETGALSAGGTETLTGERELILRRAQALFTEKTGQTVSENHLVVDRLPGTAALAAGIDTAIVQPGTLPDSAYVTAVSDIQSIMRCCTTYQTEEGELPITDEIRKTIFTAAARLEFIGAKILAAASRPAPYLTLTKVVSLHTGMCFRGFFSLAEMPAAHTKELVRKIREANLRFILLSDNPEHDLYYGHELKLFNKKTKIVPHYSYQPEYDSEKSMIITVPPYHLGSTADDLAAAAIRHRIVSSAGGKTTAFLTKEPLDSRSLSAAGCGIAVSRSNRKPAAQALKNQAQVIVYPDAEEEHGGFAESMNAMTESRRALINIANAAGYLTAAQTARLFILLLSVIFGFSMPDPAAILISGLLFDFIAVLAMAFEKAPADVLSVPCSPMPDYRLQLRFSLPFGTLCGLLCTGLPVLLNRILPLIHLHSLKDRESLILLTASLLLGQLALSVQFGRRGRLLRRGSTVNSAGAGLALTAVLFTLLMMFGKHTASLLGGAPVPWYAALTAFLPAAVLLLVMELAKVLRK